jgi:hypothetical protein
MDESEFTAEQAADPATPAQVLADIAALRADLRPIVARNPSAYPGLLEWLGSLGEPGVDAALAERREAEAAAAGAATQVLPAAPAQPGLPPAPSWASSAPGVTGPTTPATPAGPAGPYAAEPAAWQGQPAAQPWQAQVPPPGQYGAPVGAPYGAPAGLPPKKRSLAWLWILLGVIAMVIIGGVIAVIAFVSRAADALGDITETLPAVSSDAGYGDDAALDALWDACAAEDWQACDDLYSQAPIGSEYETFGDTCGNRTTGDAYCVEELGGGAAPEASGYGDDPALDALWDACEGGDNTACDTLYEEAPIGSEYEAFGDTCGGRLAAGTGRYCDPARN